MPDHSQSGALAHHFETYEQQKEASNLGMWLFLVTEVMFFGGFFLAYIVYRSKFPGDFAFASHELDVTLGTTNTAVLIASSLTMAMAVRSAALAKRKAVVGFLILTMLFGGVFLGIKAHEYHSKWEHHLVPGPHFQWHGEEGADPHHAEMFYNFYFGMTGLHAAHMVIGIGLLIWLCFPAWKGRFNQDYHNPVEVVGLYWHFVDIIWIFLFPLLYLIGFHMRGH